MQKIINYIVVPVIIATFVTILFAMLIVNFYSGFDKYQIATFCFMLELSLINFMIYARWFIIDQPKLKKNINTIAEVNDYFHQERLLLKYINTHNLKKIYVSRLMFNHFFKTTTIARIAPDYHYYNLEYLKCKFIVDPYLQHFEFGMIPKNEIITDFQQLLS